jgi:hypothetical protein
VLGFQQSVRWRGCADKRTGARASPVEMSAADAVLPGALMALTLLEAEDND